MRAVASHADFLGVSRDSPMEKTLFAVDELCGFLMACAYVRPEGIHGMTPKSVKKKMKTPAFAAAINRDELREGAEELGVDFDEHVAFVIAALEERSGELASTGRAQAAADGAADHRPRGRRDRPGAARAVACGSSTPACSASSSSSSASTSRWRSGARRATRSSTRPRARCARRATG